MKVSKVLIVAVVLLALLFSVGVGLGLKGESDSLPGWVETLRKDLEKASKPPALRRDEIKPTSGMTFKQAVFTLPESSSGQATLKKNDKEAVRSLRLHVLQGNVVVGYIPHPDDAERAMEISDLKLKPGKKMELQILTSGGRLSLTCLSGSGNPSQCRVRIE